MANFSSNYTSTLDYYNNHSVNLAARYAALNPQKLYKKQLEVLDELNLTGQILEIGGGMGRDADFFAQRYQKDVYVVEPATYLMMKSFPFLEKEKSYEAMTHEKKAFSDALEYAKDNNTIYLFAKDELPAIERITKHTNDGMIEPFSFINVNAVWQHISPKDRQPSADKLKSLLAPGGIISVKGRKEVTLEQTHIAWETTAAELCEQFSDLEKVVVIEEPDFSKPESPFTFISAIFRKPSL